MADRDTKESFSEILQLVSFCLGNEEFAVDILKVQEINRMTEITKIPKSPDFVEGVINLRGRIVPVVDLGKRFQLGIKSRDNNTRIVVVNLDDHVIGLLVDSVSEVLRLPMDLVEPPPAMITGIKVNYIRGIGKLDDRLIVILNLEKLFSGKELKEIL